MLTRTRLYFLVVMCFLLADGAVHAQTPGLTGVITSLVPPQTTPQTIVTVPYDIISVADVSNQSAIAVTVKHSLYLYEWNEVSGNWAMVTSQVQTTTLAPWGSISGWTNQLTLTGGTPGSYCVGSSLTQPIGKNVFQMDARTHYFTVQ